MCGRFAFFQEIEPIVDDLDAVDLTDQRLRARWNIPPTAPIYVVTEAHERGGEAEPRALRIARWGLLPPFAKDESFSSRTFNARRETLRAKPSFRGSLARSRALVPMDAYYEWMRRGSARRQPFAMRAADGSPLLMAALVSWWKGPGGHGGPAASADGSRLLTATVITRAATGRLAEIHDREPVMLRRDAAERWLDPELDDPDAAQSLIESDDILLPQDALDIREVDPAVGSVRADGPELLEPPQRLL